MLKKSVLALLTLAVTFIAATCSAMTFNQPVKVGYYADFRAGGPSQAIGQGYTKKTSDSFIWGAGDSALTIKYHNNPAVGGGRGSSYTKGVYVGKTQINTKVIGPDLYKMTSTDGQVFYISLGTLPGLSQNFSIIGKCAGSYWNILPISALVPICADINNLDFSGAKELLAPYAKGNQLILPYTDNLHKDNKTTGYFVFTWDDAAQWFGIDRRDV
jgi:hypothetical protein